MVNSALLTTVLAATVSATVTGMQTRDEPSMSLIAQNLPQVGSCPTHNNRITIQNNCRFPIHIWRDDSVVDKAANLAPGSAFSEPLRQDWRSGLMSYRISPFELGPYRGQPTTFITYFSSTNDNSGYFQGQGYHVLGNPFRDHKIDLYFDTVDLTCKDAEGKEISPNSQKDTSFAAAYFCESKINEIKIGLTYVFCA